MAFFDEYSARARRVIFWSLHYARKAGSGYIEPEHILQGLLKEDPQLFGLVAPEMPNLVKDLRDELATQGATESVSSKKDLPLSPTAKDVVLSAGVEQKRLGHPRVATQHLLLALLTAGKKKSLWMLKPVDLPVQQLLSKHGITADLVEAKTRGGIMTPVTWVFDDEVLTLNAQIAALAELLIGKGVFTRPEFVSLLDQNSGPIPPEAFLLPLIDALGNKGILTLEEQHQVKTIPPKDTGDKV